MAIVVVIHDSAAELAVLLASIERCLGSRPHVVVVDNDSADHGVRIAREWGAEVVGLQRNVGYGAANNSGLERVTAPVCALLNPDIELLDDGLTRLAAQAQAREVLLVPRLLNDDGSPQRGAHPLPGRPWALLPALLPATLLPRRLRLDAEPWRSPALREVGWAIAAAIVSRTSTLRRLGPFDPQTFMFYEDLELCLRARAAGIATLLDPRVELHHGGGHSTLRAYGGEPHELLARRRRAVIGAYLGPSALAWDDAAQALTFVTRAGARVILRRDFRREREQLKALRDARAD
ncbi:MAG: glycosyltransferase family 2 protein [Solirubrobacteraceae bacterium]